MTPADWDRTCMEVRDAMAKYLWPFVTPISRSETEGRGQAWGTGNYVQFRGAPYLLTAGHVIYEAEGAHMGHLPGPTNEYVALAHHIQVAGWPIDVALMHMWDEWTQAKRPALSGSLFDESFAPMDGEVLFFLGFPGSTATRHEPATDLNKRYTWFGQPLETIGVPMLTQVFRESIGSPLGFDPHHHVAVHFPARALRQAGVADADLPNPGGFSGSLLWDTKFVADTRAGLRWSPKKARVCGLIWAAYGRPEVVVATKIEHVRPDLLDFLRHEAAHFHWIDGGKPLGEQMVDWTWAEQTLTGLE